MHDLRRFLLVLREWTERTPLTDPRSVGGSILFHALLLLVASAAALSVATPAEPQRPRGLTAELEPVDNRAKPASEGEGGGSPGELGGSRLATALDSVTPPSGASAGRAAPAETLIAEILPTPVASETLQQALPGPQTSSFGLLPGSGAGNGGGGGSGGGMGGGTGRGVGPGTEFFGLRENAHSFAFVIDCSGSMAARGSLEVAKRELMASLSQLPPDAQFAVVFYNLRAFILSDPAGKKGLMAATAGNKDRVGTQLAQIAPDGGTDHMTALRTGLGLRPEVIYFLTDADLMTQGDVNALLGQAGGTRIQAVEFGRGMDLQGNTNPLRRLAGATGGTYRYIDVTSFPRPN